MDRRKFLGLSASALAAGTVASAMPLEAAGLLDTNKEVSSDVEKRLKLRFIGTGAADWKGRDSRGELRRLTSILLDSRILVDFTPSDEDMLPAGCHPEVIFYTHSHSDHYNPEAALKVGVGRVYLSSSWYDAASSDFKKCARELGVEMPEILPLYVGQAVTEAGIRITPLPANHVTGKKFEQTLIYLIEKYDTRLLYATDTGGIPALAARLAGIDAHVEGKPITALIMEATMGLEHEIDFRIYTHSSVADVMRVVRVLENTSRYAPEPGQKVYLTHLARTLHGTQAELDASLPEPLKAAWDGLEIIL